MDAEELRFHHESGTKDRTPDPQADERSTEAGDCITDSEDRGATETGTLWTETLYGESKAAAGTDTGIRTGLFACHRKTEYISSSDPGYGTAADS